MTAARIKTCALRSGSSGNAVFVGHERTRLLIDAGVCLKTLEQSLQEIGESAGQLDGVLITHEHTDHVSGVGPLLRRYKIPLYVNLPTWAAMQRTVGAIDERLVHLLADEGGKTEIGDFGLTSFRTPHDAAASVGYRIETDSGAVAVFTDIGSLRDGLLDQVSGCRAVYIEANYDHSMLMAGSYPAMLKKRIAGSYGHLSNEDCATAVCRLAERGTEHFVLSHISKDNNYPELALLTVNSRLQLNGIKPETDLKVAVARRFAISTPVSF